VKNESLKVDGNELEITKGLLFTVTASTSTTQGNLRVDIKNMRLWVAGSDTIVIPNVAAGKQVTVIAKTSAGSSSTDKERGVNVSANVKPLTGKFNQVSADQVTNVGVVEQEGDVMLTFSGAMYLYELSVSDADDDEEGNDDPTPTPVPSINDYSTSANAMMNQVIINTQKYGNRYYNTSSVSSIDINEGQIVVNQAAGNYTFNEGVTSISFKKATTDNQGTIVNVEGQVQITEARGWFESAYVKFAFFENATKYNVYVKGGSYADYTKIDEQLVRNYGTYGRADVLGLKAGSDYCIKVVPVISDREVATAASEATVP
jgi:hypothetical protein